MADITLLWGRWSPARVIVTSFAVVIAAGTLLLQAGWASAGAELSWLDALFTATSATCVTGLVVVDTGSALSPAGQGVVLALIQLGGLGIMSFSTLALVMMGRPIQLHHRQALASTLSHPESSGIKNLVLRVVAVSIAFELAGALLLLVRWPSGSPLDALWSSVFHSVSAFNNAGFSTLPNSLIPFQHDAVVNLTVMGLIIAGGIGFPVLSELASLFRRRRNRPFLSLHSKVVLAVTAALLILGTLAVYLLETPGTISELGPHDRLMAAAFQAVTPRTAGFSTLPIRELHAATLFLLVLLMFVGGSPGSTAGGVKTTSLGVLLAFVWSRARGQQTVNLLRRTISEEDVRRAVAVVAAALTVLILGTFVLLILEHPTDPGAVGTVTETLRSPAQRGPAPHLALELFFEAVSALGTVGLSTGVTPTLGAAGKLVVILLMFAGRTGPLTLAVALGQIRTKGSYRYPETRVLVG